MKHYSVDEKLQAIRLAWGRPATAVAKEFGTHAETVRRWKRAHDAGEFGKQIKRRPRPRYDMAGNKWYPAEWQLPYEYDANCDWYIIELEPIPST